MKINEVTMKLGHIAFFILLSFVSCADKSKNPQKSENAFTLKVESLEPITLGGVKYKRQIITGVNRAFDAIKEPDGSLLIMQFEPRKILKFNSKLEFIAWIGAQKDGNFTSKWEHPETYSGESIPLDYPHSEPHSFVSPLQGAGIFSVVYYGRGDNQNANTIVQYDLESGNFLSSFGILNKDEFSKGFTSQEKKRKGETWFKGIVNASYDKNLNFYVSDYGNCALYKFDSNYEFIGWIGMKNNDQLTDGWDLRSIPKCSSTPGGFDRLHGMAFDSDENIYVADTWNHRIQKFNKEGRFIGWIGSLENGVVKKAWERSGKAIPSNLEGGFNAPIAIKIDKSDNIYLLEYLGSRLQKMTSNGKVLWILDGFSKPYGLQIYDNGFIVSDTDNQKVIIFTQIK